jgi:hypothetical protein
MTVDEMIKDIQRRYEWMDSTHTDALKKLSLVGSESGWYPRSGFAILDVIGKGQFGQVSRGVVFVEGTAVVCAVKQVRSNA